MKHRALLVGTAALGLVAATAQHTQAGGNPHRTTTVVYDSFSADGGYAIGDYLTKWVNGFGPGEMAFGDTREFDNDTFHVAAAPFQTAADFSVFDHIKYLATSTQSFDVPAHGSVTFSAEISAATPGTQPGRVVHGCYGPSGSFTSLADPCDQPYSATVLEGQQAGATLHMIDFATGQLFDWFVSGSTAFILTERLPATLIGPAGGTRDTMYTQIIDEFPISSGPHTVAITYTREPGQSYVEFFLDGRRVAKVGKVGVPLDAQNRRYTGIYPSMGPGEILKDEIGSVFIGHGLFSLLDAFPFQHPDAPELSVSIPLSERIFGQGAIADFDDFVVTTVTKG
jgi:hypothetical protein